MGGLKEFSLTDGSLVQVSPEVNDASASIQYVLGKMLGYQDWQIAAGPLGLYANYLSLFGNPSSGSAFPSFPADLAQPELQLPFEKKQGWFFTSGPHSAWGDGAAWAALDFAPDEEVFGCYDSTAWVTAAADGSGGQVRGRAGDPGPGWRRR